MQYAALRKIDLFTPFLLTAFCLLLSGLTGCEQLQRKFTRKPKLSHERPDAVIAFQDYNQASTPLDRYKKHYTLFQYWNKELLYVMTDASINYKRLKKQSAESLAELKQLRDLLVDHVADEMNEIIEEREGLDRQLRTSRVGRAQINIIRTVLERQTRIIHSNYYWRDIEDSVVQTVGTEGYMPAHREGNGSIGWIGSGDESAEFEVRSSE